MAIHSVEYKDWSARFHNEHARTPIVIQIELTYRCPLHCCHCYCDCYNNSSSPIREMSTEEVMRLLDKLHEANCLWLTFTGGDPMMRKDFIELYRYAKKKGFILSLMTSLAALSEPVLSVMKELPPFSVEMTLNAATEETYARVTQVHGMFAKVERAIDRMREAGLPLKIKTLLSVQNSDEREKIREFVESKGYSFTSSTLIFARLNGDTAPCRYRLPVAEVMRLNYPEEECAVNPGEIMQDEDTSIEEAPQPDRFYRCAIGNWQWHINPQGELNICSCVRKPSYDILHGNVEDGVRELSRHIKTRTFTRRTECAECRIWHLCHSCPGKAYLELSDEEKPVPYFCELAKEQADYMRRMHVRSRQKKG